MYDINAVAQEFDLSVDDLRTMMMDVRDDWDSTQTLTASEYELIKRTVKAPQLPEGSEIAPVQGMDLNQQQQMIQNASQVLNTKLMLALAEEIAILDAVDVAKNQIILSNRQARQLELAQVINQDWKQTKTQLLDGLRSLTDYVLPQVEVGDSGVNAMTEINRIQAELGKKIVR